MATFKVTRDGTTVEDAVYDVDPVVTTANPFGDYAVAKIDDSAGQKFDAYQRGTRLDVFIDDPDTLSETQSYSFTETGTTGTSIDVSDDSSVTVNISGASGASGAGSGVGGGGRGGRIKATIDTTDINTLTLFAGEGATDDIGGTGKYDAGDGETSTSGDATATSGGGGAASLIEGDGTELLVADGGGGGGAEDSAITGGGTDFVSATGGGGSRGGSPGAEGTGFGGDGGSGSNNGEHGGTEVLDPRVTVDMAETGGGDIGNGEVVITRTDTDRFTGYVVERRETEQSGADALEVEAYSFDQFLRRNSVTNDQTGNTITEALADIIATDTPVSYVAGNVDVGDDQELTRSYQGEKVENVLRDLAFKSNNEEFGVNDSLEFFFRPRESTHIDRGIDNSQWFNYDIPELGKQAINEVEVWFNGGDESVVVDDGTDKLDLQDNLNLPEPGTQRAELQREDLTDIGDAEDEGRKYLEFRNATLSGTVTTRNPVTPSTLR